MKRGEIMDWQRLIWLLEMHATWCVTSNIASGGINRFKRMVSGVFNGGDNRSLFLGSGDGGNNENDFVEEYVEAEGELDIIDELNELAVVPESVVDSDDDFDDVVEDENEPEVKHSKLLSFLRGTKHKGPQKKLGSKNRRSTSKSSWKSGKRYVGDPKHWSTDVLRRVTRSHNYLPAETKANLLLGGTKYSH